MIREAIPRSSLTARQRGLALFISLVILLVLSLLAIVTLSATLKETNKVNDFHNTQLAELAANSAINEAKTQISRLAKTYGAAQVCLHTACARRENSASISPAEFLKSTAAQATQIHVTAALNSAKNTDENPALASQSIYVIEDLAVWRAAVASTAINSSPLLHSFRITARGVGTPSDAVKVIESIYSVPD